MEFDQSKRLEMVELLKEAETFAEEQKISLTDALILIQLVGER